MLGAGLVWNFLLQWAMRLGGEGDQLFFLGQGGGAKRQACEIIVLIIC
jgi:hypothetical protein